MEYNKSNVCAGKYRIEGNSYFEKKQYYQSIIYYNKSLCYAETPEFLADAYANRSAAFFYMKQYQASIESIQLSKNYTHSKEKMKKLLEIEEKCKFLWQKHYNPETDPNNFFKLSYPANDKIPFITDNLRFYKNKIIAIEDLKFGDIIAIEKPIINIVSIRECYQRCCRCASSNKLNLIPCSKKTILMFCSEECRVKTYEKVPEDKLLHLIDFSDGRSDIHNFFAYKSLMEDDKIKKKNRQTSRTIFNCDLSKPNAANYDDRLRGYFKKCFNIKKDKPINKQISKKISTFNHNGQHCSYSIGMFGFLFQHSCLSNVDVISYDNKFVYYICKTVEKDEELTICFESHFSLMECKKRMQLLFKNYEILCQCPACEEGLQPIMMTNFVYEIPETYESALMLIKDIWNKKSRKIFKCVDEVRDRHSISMYMSAIAVYLTYGYFEFPF